MRTKGFVLVMCLLFGLLCTVLALAALTLSGLSSQLNQALLRQQQGFTSARLPARPALITSTAVPVLCPAQFSLWPETWQKCQISRPQRADLITNHNAGVVISWQTDLNTHGGEL